MREHWFKVYGFGMKFLCMQKASSEADALISARLAGFDGLWAEIDR